jgi:NADH:ubiquinone oxidoreductase subunit 3 (subunit A)
MLYNYLNLLGFISLSLGVSCLLLSVSLLLALSGYVYTKKITYECGGLTFDDFRTPFFIQFYLVSVLFILFDVEITFITPWCLCFYDLNVNGFISGLLFFAVLSYGYVFEWRGGLLFF